MDILVATLILVAIAMLCFARLELRTAILIVLIGGWWALPVGHYGAAAPGTTLPWWITGIALPTNMLLTKAWIPPLIAFVGAAWRDPATLRGWRPAAIDLPIAAWCLWPLSGAINVVADPQALIATAYVAGSWGLPWLIGRVWFARPEGRLALTQGLALSGIANVPVAIIEGLRPPMLYGLVYGPHPFRFDGIARYVGYRPIGFLENGNLYGLWTAMTAFAALWLLRGRARQGQWVALAVVNIVVALAAQSIGALILLGIGLALLWLWRSRIFVPAMGAAAAAILLVAVVHLSGIIPLQSMARTAAGQHAIAAMRSIGRGSLLWRVSQDAKTLPSISEHLIAGSGRWDWWRSHGTRPSGQAMLLIGQYGLVGLVLAWGALLAACTATFARLRKGGDRRGSDAALPLAIIILLALADATLNAFFFSPAILAAGAIAASAVARRGDSAGAA